MACGRFVCVCVCVVLGVFVCGAKSQQQIKKDLVRAWSGLETYEQKQSGQWSSDKQSQDPFVRFKRNWSGLKNLEGVTGRGSPFAYHESLELYRRFHAEFEQVYPQGPSYATRIWRGSGSVFRPVDGSFSKGPGSDSSYSLRGQKYDRSSIQAPYQKYDRSSIQAPYSTREAKNPREAGSAYAGATYRLSDQAYPNVSWALRYQNMHVRTPEGYPLQQASRRLSLNDINRFAFVKNAALKQRIASQTLEALKAVEAKPIETKPKE